MSEQLESTKYMRDLRRVVEQHFDLEELKVIAFDLSIDWDSLSGETKPTKIQGLIMHLARRGRLSELATIVREERPQISIPQLPTSDKQIRDEKSVTPDPFVSYFEEMEAIRYFSDATTIAKGISLTDEILSKLRQKNSKGQIARVLEYISQRGVGVSQTLRPDLSYLDLSGVRFNFTNMQGVNFCGTNLRDSTLEGNLAYADLRGADLRGASLSGTQYLILANLQGARYNRTTTWPRQYNPKDKGLILEE